MLESHDVTRDLNRRIREVARRFTVDRDRDWPMEFFCECGCMERVVMSVTEYEQHGAFLAGHRPGSVGRSDRL